jgi:hypothetical protein
MPENLTPEDIEVLNEAMKSYGAPAQEEKNNAHIFLNKVMISKDTTKTGNLSEIEIGITPYSLRTYKTLSLVSDKLVGDELWTEYYKQKAEILSATSLSKKGFLTGLAVVQRRQIEEISEEPKKENSGWFKKKENPGAMNAN